jgi:hypothetical protein
MANEITSANVANAIVKLVAAEALPALVGNLVMGALVNRDFEQALAQAGDTVNVPITPAMTANNIAEAGTVTNQNPTLGNAQIVLNTHAEATFVIPDATRVLASPDLLRVYLVPATIAIAERIETDIFNLYPLLTANTPTGASSAMDEARIDAAETALFAAKVPASEGRFLVLSGTAYQQTRQLARFTEMQTSGDGAAIASGVVGQLKSFRVYRSQYVAKPSSTTYNVAFARSAIGLAIRRLPMPLPGTGAVAEYAEMGNFGMRVVMSYQPNTLSQQFTVDVLYGVGILRNQFGVQVQSN